MCPMLRRSAPCAPDPVQRAYPGAMGKIGGRASTEIEAPIETVFEIAADVEGSPRWQPEIKVAECVERDRGGNQVLVHMETDAKVRRVKSEMRFSFSHPARI